MSSIETQFLNLGNHHATYSDIDPRTTLRESASGKTVFISGASQGIGRATAVAFAQAGAKAVYITARSEKGLGETRAKIRADYAQEINKHFCAIATASVYKYGVAKYFEIPAAGALLLAETTLDITRAGFAPWHHYVPIQGGNVMGAIEYVLSSDKEDLDRIRKNGRTLVRNSHGMLKRIKEFKKLTRDL